MHEAIHSPNNLPGFCRETAWKNLTFGAFKGILSSQKMVIKINGEAVERRKKGFIDLLWFFSQ